ncbi:MAG: hypothetical protein ING75_18135, partial [Rhodocyclaceae bacterium]|nr:hypothetical protein [Rhodocyclaceae bacterium]
MITTKLNFATALVATLISLTTHAQVSSVTSKHVVVRQTAEAQSCATVCALKEAFLGSPHAVGEMLKLGTAARAVHGTAIDGIPQFPRKSSWVGPNESDLIAEYNTFFQANIAAYATTVTTWQANNGLATASHDIIQKIEHRGKTKRAVVNLITFDNGNYYYNAVKIVADDPTAPAQVLYVRAIPSAPGPNLPAAFNWPTPGTLQYAMRSNFDFITSAGFTSVTVGPVYDEPFNYNNVAVNPDARLVCLFNRTSAGCGQSQPDVAGLIGTNDATFAIVDYYRVVKPVGQAYAGQFAGIVNGHVTNRAVNFTCDTDATGTYSQTFQYTQQLQFVIDRYTVYPDGKWYFTQRFREQKFPASINIPSTITVTRGSTALAGIVANTSFAHHRTNALTTATAYAPNTLPIDPVSVNMGGICAASCTIQPTQSESRLCPNDASRTYTATRTFDSNGCKYNDWTDDSSSACASSCPLSTQSESRFCPNDASRTYTATRTVDAANCTYNSWTDDSSSACASCTGRPASCPAGTSDGGWGCVVGATAQWSCLDGQTPTQAGFEYYVADTSAP